jgi:hypothetical protein
MLQMTLGLAQATTVSLGMLCKGSLCLVHLMLQVPDLLRQVCGFFLLTLNLVVQGGDAVVLLSNCLLKLAHLLVDKGVALSCRRKLLLTALLLVQGLQASSKGWLPRVITPGHPPLRVCKARVSSHWCLLLGPHREARRRQGK